MHDFALGLELLDAHARVVLAVAHFGVAAGPVVDFAAVLGVAGRLLLAGVEQGLGLFEVVVVGGKVARGNVFECAPAVDEVFIMHVGGAVA